MKQGQSNKTKSLRDLGIVLSIVSGAHTPHVIKTDKLYLIIDQVNEIMTLFVSDNLT